jgi:uncharacterized membrane protein HdeD (DUF308 family)
MWLESRRTLAARGLVALTLGALLMLRPGISLSIFAFIFGAFAIVDGGLQLLSAARTRPDEAGRSTTIVTGSAAVVLGVVVFVWPGLTALAVLALFAVRAMIVGTTEVAACVFLWREGAARRAWMIGCAGTLSNAFGVFLLAFSSVGLLTSMWTIGLYAIAIGLLTIAIAWRHGLA